MTVVYAYNASGRLMGPVVLTESDMSPLEPGVYLIPGNCTNAPPPENKDGFFVAWDGNAWGYISDLSPEEPPVTEPTPEQLREIAKAARAVAVKNILVTTQAGNTFDGDETSQTRMARAVLVLSTGAAATVPWVLADNTVIQADIAELTEALALAGAAQAALWVIE